jgi:hypothetical protein
LDETEIQKDHQDCSDTSSEVSGQNDSAEDPYDQTSAKALTKKEPVQLAIIRNILRENLTDQQRSKLKKTALEIVTPNKGAMATPGIKPAVEDRS